MAGGPGPSLIESGIPRAPASLIAGGIPGRGPRRSGLEGLLVLVVRVLTGLGAIAFGVRIAREHAAFVERAADWALPAPGPVLWAGAVLCVLAGLVLLLGLAARLGALVVLLVCLVAIAGAGRVEGGIALWGPAALVIGGLVVLWRGGGAAQLLDRIDPR